MAVSIKDVALKAGVAIGTVSRVFNHYPDVLPETERKVMAAARALNYTPNANARSLSAKRPPNICLIASEMLNASDLDAMLFELIKGIIGYTRDHKLELSICTTDSDDQSSTSFIDFCKLHSISGTIVCGVKTDDPYFLELVRSDIPVVGIDIPLKGEKSGWVSVDNAAASAEAVRTLFSRGLTDLLIVAGRRNAAVNDKRMAGVLSAYRDSGRAFDPLNCVNADFSQDMAYEKTLEWLRRGRRPDAVFCFSDIMALGVYRALAEMGLRIPQDVSVIGFDGMPFTSVVTPPMSTVRQEMRQMGEEAARMVHCLMTEECCDHHILVPHSLLLRESVQNEFKG